MSTHQLTDETQSTTEFNTAHHYSSDNQSNRQNVVIGLYYLDQKFKTRLTSRL